VDHRCTGKTLALIHKTAQTEIEKILGTVLGPFMRLKTVNKITINVPLFKKMRDIIFFLRHNNFLSRFEGHFEGAKTFLTP
jgi:hypothetical protein